MSQDRRSGTRGIARRDLLRRGGLAGALALLAPFPGRGLDHAVAADGDTCASSSLAPAPLRISGLKAWYKADAITGIADGATLTSWPDSSESGLSLAPVGAAGPTWHAHGHDGQPVVRFTKASAERMSSVALPEPLTKTTYFVAFRPAAGAYGSTSTVVDGANGRHALYLAATRQPAAYAGKTVWDRAFDLSAEDSSVMVTTGVFAGADSVLRYMGQPLAVGHVGNLAMGRVVVGGDYGGNSPFEGDVLEVVLFSRRLSAAECLEVETYLGDKWSIPGLRMEQPFLHDDFAEGLGPQWTVHATGASVTAGEGRLRIAVPGGSAHGDLVDATIPAPRVQQTVSDGPFDIAVRWDSVPANWGEGDGHGILAVRENGDVVRVFNGYHVGSVYQERAKVHHSVDGANKLLAQTSKKLPSTWLRLRRHGNYWTAYRSPNGVSWYRLIQPTYLPGGAVSGLALVATNGGPVTPAYTSVASRTYDVGGAERADLRDPVADRVVTQRWAAADFAGGLPVWLDDVSQNGGAATIDGSRLRLSVTSARRSRGGVLFNAKDLQDCTLLMRITYVGSGYKTWIVPVILGQGSVDADQYRPLASGWAMELMDTEVTHPGAVLVRMHESSSSGDQGPYDFPEANVRTPRPRVASFWLRMERRGPRVRVRYWADGDSEPKTWPWDVHDETIPGPGRPYVVYSFNDGERPEGAHVFVDAMTVEELSP